MSESDLPESDALTLAGTTDSGTDFKYPEEFENYHLKMMRNFARLLSMAMPGGNALRVFKDGDLTFGVRAGRFMDGATARNYAGADTQALTDDKTNYIYLTAGATLTVSDSAFPAAGTTPHIPLATILAADGEYAESDITDYRGRGVFQVASSLTPALAVEAATFFGATDISGAEAETLTDGSVADTLHKHGTVEAVTDGSGSPNVLAASESGKIITNEGVTAKAYNTLPTAAAGLQFTFYCQDTDGIRVTAAASDTIRISDAVSVAAGYVEATEVGSVVHLVAINATEWVATTAEGTWDVETS